MGQMPNDPRNLRCVVAARSDVGRRRDHNEDALLYDNDLCLYVVADGMGGHVGGELASKIAVHAVVDGIRCLVNDPYAELDGGLPLLHAQGPRGILRSVITSASHQIFSQTLRNPGLRGMGTTVVALWMRGNMAYMANVGDSRGYLVRDGAITQMTVDHSVVGEQLRAGILTEADAKLHRQRNIITRSVGFQELVEIDIEARAMRAGDLFVLCSDGLTNMMRDAELLEIVTAHPVEAACTALIDRANAGGGDDNISVVLVRIEAANADADTTEDWDETTAQM